MYTVLGAQNDVKCFRWFGTALIFRFTRIYSLDGREKVYSGEGNVLQLASVLKQKNREAGVDIKMYI